MNNSKHNRDILAAQIVSNLAAHHLNLIFNNFHSEEDEARNMRLMAKKAIKLAEILLKEMNLQNEETTTLD